MVLGIPAQIDILTFPYHTQAIDCCVKLDTQALAAERGTDARNGFIRSKISSRIALPKYKLKD